MREDCKYVYENWYVKSCEKIGETPVTFEVYYKIVPRKEVEHLLELLWSGVTP